MGKIGNHDPNNIIYSRYTRFINKIIFHSTHTDNEVENEIETIRKRHIEKGLFNIGYNFLINKDGIIFPCRNICLIGAHCTTQNIFSIGICLAGKNNFMEKQFIATADLAKRLLKAYSISKSEIYPHSYFEKVKCPDFDIQQIISLVIC